MTDRQPGKYESHLHTKPWFFSGKVPEIKYSYTVSGLTPSSYPIRPRSIIPGTKLGIHSGSIAFPNIDESKSQDFKRTFKEYSYLKDQEILVTIEHCDNCLDHMSTTRHDPEKYFNLAQAIKTAVLSRYSMVKILIKPLSKLDPEVNKKRLGAFEVQLASKTRGQLVVQVVHSKLQSRKWPELSDIMQKIAKTLPNCQLVVTLFNESAQDQRAKGVKVLLRPKPVDMEGFQSNGFRPKSAATARSCKSIRAMSSRRISRKELIKPRSTVVFERVSDRDGVCSFDGIPLDLYEIEVEESKEFHSALKVVNAFNENGQNNVVNVYLGLKSQNSCVLTVVLKDSVLRTEVSQAKVRVWDKDGEEFYLAEEKRGVYEVSLEKGEYSLNVTAGKYLEVNKKIAAFDSEVLVSEALELKKSKEVFVNVYDLAQGTPLSGVMIDLFVNGKKFSGMSKNGTFGFKLEENGSILVKAMLKGYAKGKVVMQGSSELGNINVPLLSLAVDRPVVVLTYPKTSADLEVSGFCANGCVNAKSSEVDGHVLMNRLATHGYVAVYFKDSSDLRLSVKGIHQGLLGANGFLNSGVSVQYYFARKLKASFKPTFGQGEFWDVGFFSQRHQDFIETNLISNYQLSLNDFIAEYESLIFYLSIVDSVFSGFSFNQGSTKTLQSGKETFISIDTFKKSIQNIITGDFISWLVQSLQSNDGIALSTLQARFKRYVSKGLNPYKDIDEFAKRLEVEEEDLNQFSHLVKEGFYSTLPNGWHVGWNNSGDLVYLDEFGKRFEEFPGIIVTRKKIWDLKREEIKKKSLEAEENKSVKHLAKKNSGSDKSSEKNLKEDEARLLDEKIKELHHIYEYSQKYIEQFNKTQRFDKDNHSVLLNQITSKLEDCKHFLKQLTQAESQSIIQDWITYLTEISSDLLKISNDFSSSSKPEKSSSKSSSSSSSSDSSSKSNLEKSLN